MSQQYKRRISLVVGDDAGNALDLSELKIYFNVRQWDLQTPNSAVIKVWNPSDRTVEQVRKEFTRVVLQAGYQDGPFGTIFEGTIIQAYRGRENAVNTYLNIIGADGDEAYNFALVNKSLKAGSTAQDRLSAVVKPMADHGVQLGYTPELPQAKLPRGVALFGMSRDHLRSLGFSTETKPSIQDGQVQMVPLTGVIPGPAVVVNSASGMIGIPEQTQDGIRVRMLLNPQVKMGRAIQINNADINQAQLAVSLQGQLQNAFLPRVTDDGFYRVIVAEHAGGNRDNDFYTDATCIALDDGVTPGLVAKGYG